jgi:hypothetical protein
VPDDTDTVAIGPFRPIKIADGSRIDTAARMR